MLYIQLAYVYNLYSEIYDYVYYDAVWCVFYVFISSLIIFSKTKTLVNSVLYTLCFIRSSVMLALVV